MKFNRKIYGLFEINCVPLRREILIEKGLPLQYKQETELVKRLQQNLTISEKSDLEISDKRSRYTTKQIDTNNESATTDAKYVHVISSIKRCVSFSGDIKWWKR